MSKDNKYIDGQTGSNYEWNTLYRGDAIDYIQSFYDYTIDKKKTLTQDYLVETLSNLLYNLQDECGVNTEYAMKKALYRLAENDAKYVRYTDIKSLKKVQAAEKYDWLIKKQQMGKGK